MVRIVIILISLVLLSESSVGQLKPLNASDLLDTTTVYKLLNLKPRNSGKSSFDTRYSFGFEGDREYLSVEFDNFCDSLTALTKLKQAYAMDSEYYFSKYNKTAGRPVTLDGVDCFAYYQTSRYISDGPDTYFKLEFVLGGYIFSITSVDIDPDLIIKNIASLFWHIRKRYNELMR